MHAFARGPSIGFGMRSLIKEVGVRSRVKTLTDAKTGNPLASRRRPWKPAAERGFRIADAATRVREHPLELTKFKGTYLRGAELDPNDVKLTQPNFSEGADRTNTLTPGERS